MRTPPASAESGVKSFITKRLYRRQLIEGTDMAIYIAFLRAVNVGGTGSLAMSDLKKIAERIGFEDARTYIQSGNLLFRSKRTEASVGKALAEALAVKMKVDVGVLVRTVAELEETLANNPFSTAPANRVIAFFLDKPPVKGSLDAIVIPGQEEVRAVGREIFVHYPEGQGRSKLKLAHFKSATGRNLNTVKKLVELAASVS
jgi:uncharacterized protein (DUF1697 family)